MQILRPKPRKYFILSIIAIIARLLEGNTTFARQTPPFALLDHIHHIHNKAVEHPIGVSMLNLQNWRSILRRSHHQLTMNYYDLTDGEKKLHCPNYVTMAVLATY